MMDFIGVERYEAFRVNCPRCGYEFPVTSDSVDVDIYEGRYYINVTCPKCKLKGWIEG